MVHVPGFMSFSIRLLNLCRSVIILFVLLDRHPVIVSVISFEISKYTDLPVFVDTYGDVIFIKDTV